MYWCIVMFFFFSYKNGSSCHVMYVTEMRSVSGVLCVMSFCLSRPPTCYLHFAPSTLPPCSFLSPAIPQPHPHLLPSSLSYPFTFLCLFLHSSLISSAPLALFLPSLPLSFCKGKALSVTVGLFVYRLQGHVFARVR